ncbi:hypothetical protein N185_17580 [Sinorhizobium sp. GW3]|nr:hypothetical protein N185_17580 [Sinorhizobium sp. GW3]
MLKDEAVIVEHTYDRASLLSPLMQKKEEICLGGAVNAVKWFVQQDKVRVLDNHSSKQHALKLAAGKHAQGNAFPPRHTDTGQGFRTPLPVLASGLSEKASLWEKAKIYQVFHACRK